MQNAVVKLFPKQIVKYQFINRGKHHFPEGFAEELRASVNAMAELKLTKDEKKFMAKTCPYIDLPYLDFLEGYRYDPSEVIISQNGNEVEVTVEGLWYRTILWEVPLLALISELHYEMNHLERNSNEIVIENTLEKSEKLNDLGVTYAEFGTRRRHSYKVHDLVIGSLAKKRTPNSLDLLMCILP
jgi:nicotinate phosphoribosyltransferase